MAKPPKIYQRLTRNTAGVATYSSLWLAVDHVLIVSSTGFSETYARIMFADIKAFFITSTGRRLWWGIVWHAIAAICALGAIVSLTEGGTAIAWSIGFALAVVAVVLNWWMGAGCRVHVMTGVQNTALPALVRMRRTRAVLDRLQPLIVAAQSARAAEAAAAPPVGAPPEPPEIAQQESAPAIPSPEQPTA